MFFFFYFFSQYHYLFIVLDDMVYVNVLKGTMLTVEYSVVEYVK